MPASRPIPPPSICVVDSVCVIKLKARVKLEHQWAYFLELTELLEAGYLAFPKQVAQELVGAKYTDMPGGWMAGNRSACRYPEPSDEALAEVLGLLASRRQGRSLVDPNASLDKADPYVVAMAWDLRERYQGSNVLVATEDVTDRPGLLSPATACLELGISRLDGDGFGAWVNAAYRELTR